MNERLLKIRELANKTNLTNRTIRYYHEIGLLEPAERIEVLKKKIRPLKYLGCELEEIKDCLENPDYDLEGIIYRQMKKVRTEIEVGKELYSRLQTIANHLRMFL